LCFISHGIYLTTLYTGMTARTSILYCHHLTAYNHYSYLSEYCTAPSYEHITSDPGNIGTSYWVEGSTSTDA
jgi:hypothetical protein